MESTSKKLDGHSPTAVCRITRVTLMKIQQIFIISISLLASKVKGPYTAIGRFSSETERIHALECLISDLNSNVNIRSPFRQWDLAHIRDSQVGETFRSMYGDLSTESVVAQPRKRASGTQGSTDELHATEQNRLKIKADIAKLREELTKIEHRAIEIKELIRTKNNEVDEEVMLENEDANKTMNIIMDGRVTCIPRDDVICYIHVRHCTFSIL